MPARRSSVKSNDIFASADEEHPLASRTSDNRDSTGGRSARQERETGPVTRQIDDRLRLLREVLDLIDNGEIIASPAQTSFLRGVELGLIEASTGAARSRRIEASTPDTTSNG